MSGFLMPAKSCLSTSSAVLAGHMCDRMSAKCERKFRNAMRGRGGRRRTNEEMSGGQVAVRSLERWNLGSASTDADMKAVGAHRV